MKAIAVMMLLTLPVLAQRYDDTITVNVVDVPVFVDVPRASFVGGKRAAYLRVHDTSGSERVVKLTLLGPDGGTR